MISRRADDGDHSAVERPSGDAASPRPSAVSELPAAGRASGLAFGRSAESPFEDSGVKRSASRAWRAAGLAPIGLHEARHTAASLMIAAG